MQKSELRRIINSQLIGFNPDRMKTVHIANGFFMEILNFYYPTNLMNRIVVFQRKGKGGTSWKNHETEIVIDEIEEKIPARTPTETINRLRSR
jgi:hypothetical protein